MKNVSYWQALPYVYRAFLWCVHNTLEHCELTIDWPKRAEKLVGMEVPFCPTRLLLQDASGLNLVQDLISSTVNGSRLPPMDLVVDHGIITEDFGNKQSAARNRRTEMNANHHRYRFFKDASRIIPSLTIHPPGSGVIHQLNLERLAPQKASFSLDTPQDCVLGTDSHTPIINALGVPGWSRRPGSALYAACFGPVSLAIPPVTQVVLRGKLRANCTPTDLALHLAHRLRRIGINGTWAEFSGPALDYLPIADRAVLAGMAPEYGCQMAFFPVDHCGIAFMERIVGSVRTQRWRKVAQIRGLWRENRPTRPVACEIIVDLDQLKPCASGPEYPWQRVTAISTKPVRLAAITSCTNGAHPRMLIRAALLARNALRAGISPAPRIKTVLALSSTRVMAFLRESGLASYLEQTGFFDCGIGCGPCLGHCGSLPPETTQGNDQGCAVISGNRNFPGRIHPELDAVFLASPEQVVAATLMGRWGGVIDPCSSHPFARLWAEQAEVEHYQAQWNNAHIPLQTEKLLRREAQEHWHHFRAEPSGEIQGLRKITASPLADIGTPSWIKSGSLNNAGVLVKLGDGITTDHISPVGPIPRESESGRFILMKSGLSTTPQSYAAWRANAEVMIRGGFTSPRLHNLLLTEQPSGGYTAIRGNNHTLPIWKAARIYRFRRVPLIVLAGKEYGAGSARDWAARVTRLLGVEAVIALSFEEIHRRNLITMGVIPLLYNQDNRHDIYAIGAEHRLTIRQLKDLAPESRQDCIVRDPMGRTATIPLTSAIRTEWEANLLMRGGIPSRMEKHV